MWPFVGQNARPNSVSMSAFDPASEDEADVDREIRIDKMKRELGDLTGGSMISGDFGKISTSLEEVFLTRVCEFEKASYDTNFNRLVQREIVMTLPTELDDASLHAKLQEVLLVLAKIRCFLEHTDHLSDRELYTWLWTDALREETPDLSQLGGAWHMSPIGSCDDKDMAVFLKYYASDKERRRWKKDFPNDTLPPHCPLSFTRDRNLPQPE
jgi:hypothetical protein